LSTNSLPTILARQASVAQWLLLNPGWGRTLFCQGLFSTKELDKPLLQIASRAKITIEELISLLSKAPEPEMPARLDTLSLPMLIGCLRHSHHLFIKQRLPYLKVLVSALDSLDKDALPAQLQADLNLVFPLFSRDFIEHIYEEEDTLFAYTLSLHKAVHEGLSSKIALHLTNRPSIAAHAAAHLKQDDELTGLREITNGFVAWPGIPLILRLLYHELSVFESELHLHAQIENNILFPRAVSLEGYLRTHLSGISRYN
jgi:regulator of cell morphogenesis and NO signaling